MNCYSRKLSGARASWGKKGAGILGKRFDFFLEVWVFFARATSIEERIKEQLCFASFHFERAREGERACFLLLFLPSSSIGRASWVWLGSSKVAAISGFFDAGEGSRAASRESLLWRESRQRVFYSKQREFAFCKQVSLPLKESLLRLRLESPSVVHQLVDALDSELFLSLFLHQFWSCAPAVARVQERDQKGDGFSALNLIRIPEASERLTMKD